MWNTRERKKVKDYTTRDMEVRVRLWARQHLIVPRSRILDDMPELQNQPSNRFDTNKSTKGQEIERKQASGPVPDSPFRRTFKNGYCGMTPATFFVDSFGNVISPSAVSDALTFASVDHIFPYSRGGLSKLLEGQQSGSGDGDSNFVMLQSESNKVKSHLCPQHFVM